MKDGKGKSWEKYKDYIPPVGSMTRKEGWHNYQNKHWKNMRSTKPAALDMQDYLEDLAKEKINAKRFERR